MFHFSHKKDALLEMLFVFNMKVSKSLQIIDPNRILFSLINFITYIVLPKRLIGLFLSPILVWTCKSVRWNTDRDVYPEALELSCEWKNIRLWMFNKVIMIHNLHVLLGKWWEKNALWLLTRLPWSGINMCNQVNSKRKMHFECLKRLSWSYIYMCNKVSGKRKKHYEYLTRLPWSDIYMCIQVYCEKKMDLKS